MRIQFRRRQQAVDPQVRAAPRVRQLQVFSAPRAHPTSCLSQNAWRPVWREKMSPQALMLKGGALYSVICCGLLVLVHAFLLPYRAACDAAWWGESGNQPARDFLRSRLTRYLCSLYLIDAGAMFFSVLPLLLVSKLSFCERMRIWANAVSVRSPAKAPEGAAPPPKHWFKVTLAVVEVFFRWLAWFPCDAIVIAGGGSLQLWSRVSLLRLLRLLWMLPPTVRGLYLLLRYRLDISVGWARIASYVPCYILMSHLVACGFVAIGRMQPDNSGWVYADPLLEGREQEANVLYARAIYWSCVTMTTVGFGDIIPITWEEMLYTSAVMFLGAYTACAAIGLLMAELVRADGFQASWQKRVELADAFIKKRSMPVLLARRVQEYLQYQWAFLHGVDESTFFAGLPPVLRAEVLVFLNGTMLRRIPRFADADAELISSLASLLYPVLFLPGEVMIGAGETLQNANGRSSTRGSNPTLGAQVCHNAYLLVRGKVLEYTLQSQPAPGGWGRALRRSISELADRGLERRPSATEGDSEDRGFFSSCASLAERSFGRHTSVESGRHTSVEASVPRRRRTAKLDVGAAAYTATETSTPPALGPLEMLGPLQRATPPARGSLLSPVSSPRRAPHSNQPPPSLASTGMRSPSGLFRRTTLGGNNESYRAPPPQLRLQRTYGEGDCILPDAAIAPIQVTSTIVAATFVEVHALHSADVAAVLKERELRRKEQGGACSPISPRRLSAKIVAAAGVDYDEASWDQVIEAERKVKERRLAKRASLMEAAAAAGPSSDNGTLAPSPPPGSLRRGSSEESLGSPGKLAAMVGVRFSTSIRTVTAALRLQKAVRGGGGDSLKRTPKRGGSPGLTVEVEASGIGGEASAIDELPNASFDLPDASRDDAQGSGFFFRRSNPHALMRSISQGLVSPAVPPGSPQLTPVGGSCSSGSISIDAGEVSLLSPGLISPVSHAHASQGPAQVFKQDLEGRFGASSDGAAARRLRLAWLTARLLSLGLIAVALPLRIAVAPRLISYGWLPVDLFVLGVAVVQLVCEALPQLGLGVLASSNLRIIAQLRVAHDAVAPSDANARSLDGRPMVATRRRRRLLGYPDVEVRTPSSRNSAEQRRELRRKRARRCALLALDALACLPLELGCYVVSPLPEWLPLAVLPRVLALRHGSAWLGELQELIHERASDYYAERSSQLAEHAAADDGGVGSWLSHRHALRKVVSLSVMVLVVCHWGACGWLLAAYGYANRGDFCASWLANDAVLATLEPSSADDEGCEGEGGPGRASWWAEYLRAAYWMFVAVSTIGFGDIVPATVEETVYATLIVEFGALMYPAVVGAIATLVVAALTAQGQKQAAAREFVRTAKPTMPPHLARQIITFNALGQAVREETHLLRSLPPSLHLQLSAHLHADMLRSVQCFSVCPTHFLLEVCSLLATELFVPASFIVRTGDASQAVIFLARGSAQRLLRVPENAQQSGRGGTDFGGSPPSSSRTPGRSGGRRSSGAGRDDADDEIGAEHSSMSSASLSYSGVTDRTDHDHATDGGESVGCTSDAVPSTPNNTHDSTKSDDANSSASSSRPAEPGSHDPSCECLASPGKQTYAATAFGISSETSGQTRGRGRSLEDLMAAEASRSTGRATGVPANARPPPLAPIKSGQPAEPSFSAEPRTPAVPLGVGVPPAVHGRVISFNPGTATWKRQHVAVNLLSAAPAAPPVAAPATAPRADERRASASAPPPPLPQKSSSRVVVIRESRVLSDGIESSGGLASSSSDERDGRSGPSSSKEISERSVPPPSIKHATSVETARTTRSTDRESSYCPEMDRANRTRGRRGFAAPTLQRHKASEGPSDGPLVRSLARQASMGRVVGLSDRSCSCASSCTGRDVAAVLAGGSEFGSLRRMNRDSLKSLKSLLTSALGDGSSAGGGGGGGGGGVGGAASAASSVRETIIAINNSERIDRMSLAAMRSCSCIESIESSRRGSVRCSANYDAMPLSIDDDEDYSEGKFFAQQLPGRNRTETLTAPENRGLPRRRLGGGRFSRASRTDSGEARASIGDRSWRDSGGDATDGFGVLPTSPSACKVKNPMAPSILSGLTPTVRSTDSVGTSSPKSGRGRWNELPAAYRKRSEGDLADREISSGRVLERSSKSENEFSSSKSASRKTRRRSSGGFGVRRQRSEEDDAAYDGGDDALPLEVLLQGDHFGAESFVLGVPHAHDLVATDVCECLLLHRRPFQELLRRFPLLVGALKREAEAVQPRMERRDAAIVRNLAQHRKVLETLGPDAHVNTDPHPHAIPGHRSFRAAHTSTTAEEMLLARLPCLRRLAWLGPAAARLRVRAVRRFWQLRRRAAASEAWSALMLALLMYHLCGGPYRAALPRRDILAGPRDAANQTTMLVDLNATLAFVANAPLTVPARAILLLLLDFVADFLLGYDLCFVRHDSRAAAAVAAAAERQKVDCGGDGGGGGGGGGGAAVGGVLGRSSLLSPGASKGRRSSDTLSRKSVFSRSTHSRASEMMRKSVSAVWRRTGDARSRDSATPGRESSSWNPFAPRIAPAPAAGHGGDFGRDASPAGRLLLRGPLLLLLVVTLLVFDVVAVGLAAGCDAETRAGADPWGECAPGDLEAWLDLLWLVRICLFVALLPSQLARLESRLLETFLSVGLAQARIGRMVLVVTLLSHLASCGWAVLGWRGLFERTDGATWLIHDRVLQDGTDGGDGGGDGTSLAFLAWLRGAYYAASTYAVIVIGDITPYNVDEMMYTLLLILIGASVNSSIIGLVVGVLARVDEEEHEQATIHRNASTLMAEHGLPAPLRQRVHRYLDALHERGANRERAVLRALPPPLQLEASKHLRLKLLRQSELARVLHPSALGRLTLEMSEVVVPPGELLLLEGDVCSTSMYIVIEGQLDVLVSRTAPPTTSAPAAAPAVPPAPESSSVASFSSSTVGGSTPRPGLPPPQPPWLTSSVSRSYNSAAGSSAAVTPTATPGTTPGTPRSCPDGGAAASALVNYGINVNPQQQREALPQVVVVATLGRGATVGAASFLLDDVPPSASVRATRRSYVLQLERAKLEGVLWRRGLAHDRNHLARMNRELRQINQDYLEEHAEKAAAAARCSDVEGMMGEQAELPTSFQRNLHKTGSYGQLCRSRQSSVVSCDGDGDGDVSGSSTTPKPHFMGSSVPAALYRSNKAVASTALPPVPALKRLGSGERIVHPVVAPSRKRKPRRVLKPEDPRRRAWDLLMTCALTYLLLSWPYLLAVLNGRRNQLSASGGWRALASLWAVDALLLCDSALCATSFPFLDKGREVFLRSELMPSAIWAHYRATKMRLDLLSTLPYEAVALVALGAGVTQETAMVLVLVLRAPRLLRCARLRAHVTSVGCLLPHRLRLSGGGARLATATAVYLLVWHVLASTWLLVAYAVDERVVTWMSVDCDPGATPTRPAPWAHASVWLSYARASYFTITVLSTAGYGDVRPQNPLETCLCLLTALSAAVLFASLIGLISSLVRCGDIEEAALKTQLDYVEHFMRHHRLPPRLRGRISSYYTLLWRHSRVGPSATSLENALPHFLLRDLRLAIHRQNVLQIAPLRRLSFFPLKEVCLLLRPEVALEGDAVVSAGEPANRLYVVDVGVLRVIARRPISPGGTTRGGGQGGRLSRQHTPPGISPGARFVTEDTGSFTRKGAPPPPPPPLSAARQRLKPEVAPSPTGSLRKSHRRASEGELRVGPGLEVGHVGAEMLVYADPAAPPPLSPADAVAEVDSHLFRLDLAHWRALVKLFPAELAPIAEGRAVEPPKQEPHARRITTKRRSTLSVPIAAIKLRHQLEHLRTKSGRRLSQSGRVEAPRSPHTPGRCRGESVLSPSRWGGSKSQKAAAAAAELAKTT